MLSGGWRRAVTGSALLGVVFLAAAARAQVPDPGTSVEACIGCHGPTGHGIPPRFPKVSGQHPEYLEQQLLAFKSGSRANEVMNPIAFRLSEQQIKELALYMSALH